jgi:hypothetical protein
LQKPVAVSMALSAVWIEASEQGGTADLGHNVFLLSSLVAQFSEDARRNGSDAFFGFVFLGPASGTNSTSPIVRDHQAARRA